ncbi:hypothetical protein [Bradyrhizobium sp. USDA 4501]
MERFIFELKHDERLQAALRDKDEHLFDGFDVSSPERKALEGGAVEELYRMGVHPLLIAPYSRYAGISPVDYHHRLAALEGSRVFSSARRFTNSGE